MAEVITDCVCGQLPALEPARREVDPLTLAACSDPFCAACLGQIAANEQAVAHEFSAEPDTAYPHLARAHCSCGWSTGGYSKIPRLLWQGHVTKSSAAPQ